MELVSLEEKKDRDLEELIEIMKKSRRYVLIYQDNENKSVYSYETKGCCVADTISLIEVGARLSMDNLLGIDEED